MDVEKLSVDGFNLNVSDAKARDMISDKYDPDNGTYVVGDTCINNDILYICNTDIDTPEDFDSSKWDADTVGHYCSELKSNFSQLDGLTVYKNLTLQTSYADFDDGSTLPLISLTSNIDPVQDLHGYDYPWVGGAGKNKFNAQKIVTDSNHPNETYIENGYLKFRTGEAVSIGFVWDSINLSCPLTFHGKVKNFGDATNNVRMDVTYSDNSTERIIIANGLSTLEEVSFSVVIGDSGKTLSQMTNAWTNELRAGFDISTTQLEAGNQATSFEPYSNICPISGFTEANVSVVGKNLAESGHTWNINANGVIENINLYNSSVVYVKQGKTYVYSCNGVASNIGVIAFYTSKPTIGSTSYNASRTIPTAQSTFVAPITGWAVIRDVVSATNIQAELGSTATEYEPYNPNSTTYKVEFKDGSNPLTVYGGTLNVVSGELVVGRAYVDLGTLTYGKADAGLFRLNPNTIGVEIGSDMTCSIYKQGTRTDYAGWNARESTFGWLSTYEFIIFKDSRYTEASDFKTAMNGVQLVYELATPQTYQLTPTQVNSLLGQNYISSDTGNITNIKYLGILNFS